MLRMFFTGKAVVVNLDPLSPADFTNIMSLISVLDPVHIIATAFRTVTHLLPQPHFPLSL
jgi:hypothetical protein